MWNLSSLIGKKIVFIERDTKEAPSSGNVDRVPIATRKKRDYHKKQLPSRSFPNPSPLLEYKGPMST